ncbi:hypothetical protein GCM10023157_33850 [Gluconacetobacter asukensis]
MQFSHLEALGDQGIAIRQGHHARLVWFAARDAAIWIQAWPADEIVFKNILSSDE